MRTRQTGVSTLFLRIALVVSLIFSVMVFGMGCEDDETDESNLEEAKIALDDREYDRAIELLEGMTGKEALEVLADAYAGRVGIETFEFLSQLEELSFDGVEESVELVRGMMGYAADHAFLCTEIAEMLSDLDKASDALLESVAGNEAALTTNGKAKLAIYSFSDFVLVLAEILCVNYGPSLSPPDTIELTEAWIKNLIQLFVDDFNDVVVTADQLAQMNRDLGYVKDAAAAFGMSDELKEAFASFSTHVGGADGSLDRADVVAFLIGF